MGETRQAILFFMSLATLLLAFWTFVDVSMDRRDANTCARLVKAMHDRIVTP